ncbi:MAG: threonine synthase [Micavibrio aeruginosavorus]|uniref:Threonine synthase n=1 Tax=Micavibrio aeruginosavorus TaxID=349221 RepID=A0A2W5FT44_9BACT|nr:MAG: threonine synthase [Micavibrio aeruginosavorus]
MKYVSTRGFSEPKTFTDVLMEGLAPDGGLYVPESFPPVDFKGLKGASYIEVAEAVISPFIDFPREDLRKILEETYADTVFDNSQIAPLKKLEDGLYVMELFHGPTLAFKDVALQLLGRLFDYTLEKSGKRVTILGATSGDTGSAAILACQGKKNIEVFILHPHNRTSEIQRRQMTSVIADNIHNIALQGNFDDCQGIVKQAFGDKEIHKRLNLSAINSINWARIIGQTVYYVHACLRLQEEGIENPSFAVPTGNFGNIYAAYVAKRMGAPVDRLVIGSNRNDILTRFFETGRMSREDTIASLSPSMDIQVSSNFERFLFEVTGRNGAKIKSMMEDFRDKGSFALPDDQLASARAQFSSFRCPDGETIETIAEIYKTYGEIIDPHTAVGVNAALKSKIRPIVALACAHAAKFPDAVEKATGQYPHLPERLADLKEREEKFEVLANSFDDVKAFVFSKQ